MTTVPAVTLQNKGGGQHHHEECHPRQHQYDDELHPSQAGSAALAHRHPQQVVTGVPAATGDPLASPSTSSSSLPPHRCPSGFVGVAAHWRHIAGGSGEPGLADAAEAAGAVEAAAPVQAGLAGAVIKVDGAEAPTEPCGADAREAVDAIHAGGAVGTRLHETVIDVLLTAQPSEAGQAATRRLRRKAIGVLTEAAILTWRPADREEER